MRGFFWVGRGVKNEYGGNTAQYEKIKYGLTSVTVQGEERRRALPTTANEHTSPMKQVPIWDYNRFSAAHNIPRTLRNPQFHCRVHRNPPQVTVIQIHLVHARPSYSYAFQIHFGIIRLWLTSGLYTSLFSAKTLHAFLSSTNVPHAPNISSSWYDQPNNNWWGIRITKILNMQFSPVSWHFRRFRPKYLPQQPISDVRVPSFLNMRGQVSHPWKKTTEKITVLCILTFTFLGSKRKEEISWTE
jgi:hypothetical protein